MTLSAGAGKCGEPRSPGRRLKHPATPWPRPASMFRFRVLPQMLRDDGVMERAVHGSDIPFPANAMVFWHRLRPADLISLVTEANLFERDWKLKRALGVPDPVFARGAALLEAASG